MFESARLKITAWYMLIVMFISVLFSLYIYHSVTLELEQGFRRMEVRYEIDTQSGFIIARPPLLDPGYLEASERRVALTLVYINIAILGFSAAASYFLAGKTLRPIKVMVDEQHRFVADASHELRTPLTAAKTSIEVGLRDKELTLGQAKELLESTLEEVDTMQSLSNNLLRLSQFQKNGKEPAQEVIMNKVISKTMKKIEPLAQKKNIKLDLKTDTENEYKVKADEESLKELFFIFLDNAIKYSPEETTITVSLEKKDHIVLVSIQDQGIGIEAKDIPHIFDRFYRADKSRSKNTVAGYGLGLSIAQKIVQTYNGTINVKSKPGEGTSFIIRLPIS
jgi:signal transduction histidine kinase